MIYYFHLAQDQQALFHSRQETRMKASNFQFPSSRSAAGAREVPPLPYPGAKRLLRRAGDAATRGLPALKPASFRGKTLPAFKNPARRRNSARQKPRSRHSAHALGAGKLVRAGNRQRTPRSRRSDPRGLRGVSSQTLGAPVPSRPVARRPRSPRPPLSAGSAAAAAPPPALLGRSSAPPPGLYRARGRPARRPPLAESRGPAQGSGSGESPGTGSA